MLFLIKVIHGVADMGKLQSASHMYTSCETLVDWVEFAGSMFPGLELKIVLAGLPQFAQYV